MADTIELTDAEVIILKGVITHATKYTQIGTIELLIRKITEIARKRKTNGERGSQKQVIEAMLNHPILGKSTLFQDKNIIKALRRRKGNPYGKGIRRAARLSQQRPIETRRRK